MNIKTYTKTGNVSQRPLAVNETVFGAEVNPVLLAQAVRVYLSNQRQGTSKTQTRSSVNRTKSKWYRQKGTGNARHGSKSAPIFVGGGVAHGPTGLENWKRNLPKKLKKKAMISALSAQAENMIIANGLNDLSGKTKEAAALLKKMSVGEEKVLIILAKFEDVVMRSLRNLPKIKIVNANRVNVYEIAAADKIILTKEAVEVLEKRLVVDKNEN